MFLDDNDSRHKIGGVDDGEIYGTYVCYGLSAVTDNLSGTDGSGDCWFDKESRIDGTEGE